MTDTPYLLGVLGAIDEMRDAEDIPRLTAALRDVLEPHRPDVMPGCCRCLADGWIWPCPTVEAVSRALLAEQAAT